MLFVDLAAVDNQEFPLQVGPLELLPLQVHSLLSRPVVRVTAARGVHAALRLKARDVSRPAVSQAKVSNLREGRQHVFLYAVVLLQVYRRIVVRLLRGLRSRPFLAANSWLPPEYIYPPL